MDYRYMALNDLLTELQKSDVPLDDSTAARLIDAVLKTLEDKTGEVQNMGIKCLGPLVRRSRDIHVQVVVDRLCRGGTNNELKDLSSTAMRTVILEVAPTGVIASSITNRLLPRLVIQLKPSETSDTLLDALDVLIELLNRFGTAVSSLPVGEISALIRTLTSLLDNTRQAVRKRAVIALGALSTHVSLEVFAHLMSNLLEMLSLTKSDGKLKTLISLLGQICRAEVVVGNTRFGNYLQTVAPVVLQSLAIDDDELRETSLQSLEVFVSQAGPQIKRYEADILEQALKYLKYDPNYSQDEDEDMDDADDEQSDFGSDFDNDAEYDDDEDISWKVRRCSTKLLLALLNADPSASQSICTRAASPLIARFSEREENVRVEILLTFAVLVDRSGPSLSHRASPSRKRARDEDSEMDTDTSTSSHSVVLDLMPKLMKSILAQLGGKSVATKQACFSVLTALAKEQDFKTAKYLSQIIPSIKAALSSSATSHSTSTTASLRISILEYLIAVLSGDLSMVSAETMQSLAPIVASTVAADNLSKITSLALDSAEALTRASAARDESAVFATVCKVLQEKVASSNLDQESRDKLIRLVGEAISMAPAGADDQLSKKLCDILSEKLTSESTRVAALNAIACAAAVPAKLEDSWARSTYDTLLKLLPSLRNNSRVAGITAATFLTKAVAGQFDSIAVCQCSSIMDSLLMPPDAQVSPLMVQWLAILSSSINNEHIKDLSKNTLNKVVKLLASPLAQNAASTSALVIYFESISRNGTSATVVNALYAEISSSNLQVMSKFIAAAILADSDSALISEYTAAIKAPKTAELDRTLALYVIGECGRQGAIKDDMTGLLLSQLDSPSEQVKGAAAFAFGNFAAADLDSHLPILYSQLDKNHTDHYYLAIAMKEIIVNSAINSSLPRLGNAVDQIWTNLFKLASDDRAKNIVAECVGRLTLIRPSKFLPELQKELQSTSSAARSVVIRAIRFTFTEPNSAFDDQLRPILADFLSLIEDEDLEIRRLALSTLYSAAHNKPYLIQDHLPRIMPLLFKETTIKPELMSSVQMGPFKHVVDNGLVLRKSAFETLLTLLDSFFDGIETDKVLEIVITGLDDVQEIKSLCLLSLPIIAQKAPLTVTPVLDTITEKFMKVMNSKLRDAAVKQDKEKDGEIKRATLRCAVALESVSDDSTPGFNAFLQDMKATRTQEMKNI